jgi:hypothetical protein
MRSLVIPLLVLAACKGGEEPGENGAAPAEQADGAGASGSSNRNKAAALAADTGLTGLYEGGGGARPNQLCMVGKSGGEAEFGLIIMGAGGNNCSGAGTAVRSGERLTLTMAGDRSCAIEARFSGGTVTLPASVPEGCAYYCAAGARLAGTRFERKGATRADAMKAKDFADDPLCA